MKVAAIPKNWTDADRKKWVKTAERHLYAGRVERVIEATEALRVGRRGTAVGKCIGYFEGHRRADALRRFPGAGSAHGKRRGRVGRPTCVNLRMKGNSMYWLPEHAEAMLHLRTFLKDGRWDELVRSTIRQPAHPTREMEFAPPGKIGSSFAHLV